MDKFEKREQRVKELFEDEAIDVNACATIRTKPMADDGCQFCDSFYICKKVFEEESEGGG